MHPMFEIIRKAIDGDIQAMIEDGHDPKALAKELETVAAKGSVDALLAFQQELWDRPTKVAYVEPSDWESIAKGFPAADSHACFSGSDDRLADRVYGGVLGRVVGCQLGKPMEMAWPAECKKALEECKSWPLTDYMNPIDDPERLAQLKEIDGYGKRLAGHQWIARGHFSGGASDDDTTYSLVGMRVLERYGVSFTTEQYIDELIALCPRSQLFAAGLAMYMRRMWGMEAPCTAVFGNWSRQSLGAMIRCDPFGWAAPANPALAARMAFADARGSQTKNGIYSGIFFAVLMADTFATGDAVQSIATALSYVPPKSRFAEMVTWTMDLCRRTADWEEANREIFRRWDEGYPRSDGVKGNHSLPNAAITLMSLIYAKGDFGHGIALATMAGMDTDCNAATAGSILGIAVGVKAIAPHWTRPLDDTLYTPLREMHQVRISDIAQRMFQIAKPNCRRA